MTYPHPMDVAESEDRDENKSDDALTWQQASEAIGPHGELCVRHDCVEHPRLFCLSQRASVDTEWIELFYVYGINAQYWHTADEALQAMRANP